MSRPPNASGFCIPNACLPSPWPLLEASHLLRDHPGRAVWTTPYHSSVSRSLPNSCGRPKRSYIAS